MSRSIGPPSFWSIAFFSTFLELGIYWWGILDMLWGIKTYWSMKLVQRTLLACSFKPRVTLFCKIAHNISTCLICIQNYSSTCGIFIEWFSWKVRAQVMFWCWVCLVAKYIVFYHYILSHLIVFSFVLSLLAIVVACITWHDIHFISFSYLCSLNALQKMNVQ